MPGLLHITNGDSTRLALEQSGVPGAFQAWRDVLHDGPVPARAPLEEFRRVRSAFIASGGFGSAAAIERGYEQEDAAVLSWDTRDETVLWFEHDLYDQLLLIRLLSLLPPDAATKVTLITTSQYLGMMAPGAFPALFRTRRPITPEQIALATRAWDAFGADTPAPLLAVLDGDTAALPFLDGALRRHFEDYPDERGLSRTERQMLEGIEAGASTAGELFTACAAREERIYMGDWTFFGILRALDGLVAADSHRPPSRSPGRRMTLTDAGREVLAGRADRIALIGIDRWMGGVHLTRERPWRRPPGSARPSAA